MRKALIAFLLMLITTAPASARQPNFLDGINNCVAMTIAYTRFAQMAADAQESDHAAFIAFIQQIVDMNEDPKIKQMIANMGKQAWASRGHNVQDSAQEMYGKCFHKLGTDT